MTRLDSGTEKGWTAVSRRSSARRKSRAFSVLIPVYGEELPGHLDRALSSLEDQTLRPDEIVLVKDGPLSEALESVIERHRRPGGPKYVVVALPRREGVGPALNHGLKRCRHEWVARMDSDDIAFPMRFEKQLAFLESNADYDLVGAWIGEFEEDPARFSAIRAVPSTHEEIRRYASLRNPLNHMTVVFRKSAVEAAGGYPACRDFEDYTLWIHMLMRGAKMANLPEVLVAARAGRHMIRRRVGYRYARHEWSFQRHLYRIGYLDGRRRIRNLLLRIPPRFLPGFLAERLYRVLWRRSG